MTGTLPLPMGDTAASAAADPVRLAALEAHGILDTPPEKGFDSIVLLARILCDAPVALVSLVAADRQWFKARSGFGPCETSLNASVCAHALGRRTPLVIPDLTLDARTRENPLVTGAPGIRFYAGVPLNTQEGETLGTLCVIDGVPRPQGLTAQQTESLTALAEQVMSQLDLRRAVAERDAALAGQRREQAQAVADAARLEAMIATQQVVASATSDLDTVFRAVADAALSIIDRADGATIALRDGDDLVCRTGAGHAAGWAGRRLPIAGTPSGRAFTDETLVVGTPGEAAAEAGRAPPALMAVPVQRHGLAVGILEIRSEAGGPFGPRDILMAQMLAGLAGSAFGDVAEAETRQALREAEGRYKAIFDSAIDFAIVAADSESRITDWNTGAEQIMGWSADEVRGRLLDTFFTPEDRRDDIPAREERVALANGSSPDVRWHQRRDGGRFWAVGRMMTLRHEDDSVRGFLKILQDRTAERRHEQRLALLSRASAALLSAADPAHELLPILQEGAEALGFDESLTWALAPDRAALVLVQAVGVSPEARAALERAPLDQALFDQAPLDQAPLDQASSDQAPLDRAPLDGPLCRIVAATGRPLILSGLQADATPRHRAAREAGFDAYASFPITGRGGLTGVISFARRDAPAFEGEVLTVFATLARFLSVARERLDDEAALRESDARSRRAQQAGGIGTFEADVGGESIAVSAEFCRLFGLPEARSYPVPVIEGLILPEDAHLRSDAARRATGAAVPEIAYRIRRADDGAIRWIGRRAEFARDPAGRITALFGTVSDVTDQRAARARIEALLHLGDRLAEATDTAEAVAIAADLLGRTLGAGRAAYAAVDVHRETLTIAGDWTAPGVASLAGTYPFAALPGTMERLRTGRILVCADTLAEVRLAGDAGTYRAIGVRGQIKVPLLKAGTLVGLLLVHEAEPRIWSMEEVAFTRGVADRTYAALARLKAEEQQDLVNHELSHRMRNLLAMVQSIATQTLRNATHVDEAKDVLAGRLVALGRAHDLLMGAALTSTRIAPVVRGALQVHEDGRDRFRIGGPEIEIGADRAVSLALMLHELATNAAKYGALSNAAGHVDLTWAILDPEAEPRLRLAWIEVGGPPVTPPTRKGFGSRFIERGLASQVGGSLSLEYRPEGVACILVAPLSAFAGDLPA
ncbi:GAF domain-containing protein [Methylobacterium sp. J-090]|uniref:GAF domain-containing protein n=1 Tax=Methylobacterium sp. J-090 TaxID=2836666 RepID=UPI001FB91C39|nr:GAF domain-containing protein [Methylobacterium sp. J-090]MCJ2081129.1 GAF domain-containing protein [Methylobacterium sp. J-090]